MAVEPKTKADQEKMGIALESPGAGRPVVPRAHRRGIGPDDHLRHGRAAPRDHRRPHEARVRRRGERRQAAGRLSRDDPQAGREVEGKFVKQSGGRGQYGHVWLKIEPQEPGKGFEFVDAIKGGVGAARIHPGGRKGRPARRCPTACWPATRWSTSRSRCSTARTTRSTRTRTRSRWPRRWASRTACRKASPVLLEPMMAVEVETPEDFMGNVMGDLSSRRGMIQGMDDMAGAARSSRPKCRWREMFGYSTTLRSLSQGRATYTMEFKHYAEAPKNVAEAVDHQARRAISSSTTVLRLRNQEIRHGKGQIRAHQAARERGHDRSRGSRQDDADGGDDEGRCGEVSAARPRRTTRSTRRRKRRRAGSRSTPRTWSTRRRTATTRTWTARATPTTSRT